MAIIHANKEQFEKMLAEKKTFLADFFATWCGPCKMLGRVLENIDNNGEIDVDIVKVDVDQENELAQKYNIEVVPTLYFVKDGKTADTMSGFIPENVLVDKLKNLELKVAK